MTMLPAQEKTFATSRTVKGTCLELCRPARHPLSTRGCLTLVFKMSFLSYIGHISGPLDPQQPVSTVGRVVFAKRLRCCLTPRTR